MGEVINFQHYKLKKLLQNLKGLSVKIDATNSVDLRGYNEVSISFNDLIGEAKIEYFAHCLQCNKDMEEPREGFCSNECQEAYYIEFNKWMLERN
jgi:hypothetical protein